MLEDFTAEWGRGAGSQCYRRMGARRRVIRSVDLWIALVVKCVDLLCQIDSGLEQIKEKKAPSHYVLIWHSDNSIFYFAPHLAEVYNLIYKFLKHVEIVMYMCMCIGIRVL